MDRLRISTTHFHLFARIIGFLLALYGVGTIVTYLAFVMTGTNGFAGITDSMGILFFGFIGAFPLPLGIALFRADENAEILLPIASAALGLNALLRLSLLLVPELREIAGSAAPIVEFSLFGMLAVLAMIIRPEMHSAGALAKPSAGTHHLN